MKVNIGQQYYVRRGLLFLLPFILLNADALFAFVVF